MDNTERQVIDELFAKIGQAESQSGPRDQQAEARIREHVAQQPASPYYMAQAIVIQDRLSPRRTRASNSSSVSFRIVRPGDSSAVCSAPAEAARRLPSLRAPMWDPRVAAYTNARYGRGGSGFLAGAMQTAMGVAGGVLLGSAIASMFAPDPVGAEGPPAEDAPEELDEGGLDEDF